MKSYVKKKINSGKKTPHIIGSVLLLSLSTTKVTITAYSFYNKSYARFFYMEALN